MRWSLEELLQMWQLQTNKGMKWYWRIWHFPKGFFRFQKHLFKWIFTGRCDNSIWNLNGFLTNIIIDRLTVFIKWIDEGKTAGYPHGLSGEEEWGEILVRIRDGFIEIRDESIYLDFKPHQESVKEFIESLDFETTRMSDEDQAEFERLIEKHAEYVEETLDLFKKYFNDLWD